MARANWLADKLREYGCNVIEVNGWKSRGNSSVDFRGVVLHHTASRAGSGDAPALGICINGRSDLPGPLCNVLISRSGICYVISSGRANHAGKGSWRGVTGNARVLGIEAENNGVGEAWSYAQMVAYILCTAAMIDGIGANVDMICGHKEWATPKGRKIDPTGIDIAKFRNDVALNILARKAAPLKDISWGRGSRGDKVKEIQSICNFWGFNAGVADGIFGAQTESAVRVLQRTVGATVSGVWDSQTERAYGAWVKAIEACANAQKRTRPVLRVGSRGEDVRYLQQRLGAHGFPTAVDGIFGAGTQRQAAAFQRSRGVNSDGVVGPITWGLLG